MNDDITDRARHHHEAQIEIPDPTPFERIISWIKIPLATKRVAMVLWAMFFGVSGTAIMGQVTDTTPFKDAAIELGLIDEPQTAQEATDSFVVDELLRLQADIKVGMQTITDNQREIREHTHEAPEAPLSYDLPEHTHPPPDLSHNHPVVAPVLVKHTHEPLTHTHPAPVFEMSDAVKDAIAKEVGLSFIVEMTGHVDILH